MVSNTTYGHSVNISDLEKENPDAQSGLGTGVLGIIFIRRADCLRIPFSSNFVGINNVPGSYSRIFKCFNEVFRVIL